jgi:hypothetical protein
VKEMPVYKTNILPVGKFYHNKFGEIVISKDMIQNMVSNFRQGIPHYKLSVNKQHDDIVGAFGEIQNVEAAEDGLLAEISVDEETYQQLGNKRFKYHSAEYSDEYLDKKTGKKVGATLLGVALTNAPAHPLVPEIQLSEEGNKIFFNEIQLQNEGVEKMSEATNIKLTESKEYQDMVLKLSEATKEIKQLAEVHKEELRKLAEEKDNEIKKLTEQTQELERNLAEVENANYKLEVEAWEKQAIDSGKVPNGVKKLSQKLAEKVITRELADEMLDVLQNVPEGRLVTSANVDVKLSEKDEAKRIAKAAWGSDVK